MTYRPDLSTPRPSSAAFGFRRGRVAVGLELTDERHYRAVGVAHHGGHGRGYVVVDGTDRRSHQPVDQKALALLELSDHQHPDLVVDQPGPGLLEPGVGIRNEITCFLQVVCEPVTSTDAD